MSLGGFFGEKGGKTVLRDGSIRPRRVTATLTAPPCVPAAVLKDIDEAHNHGLCMDPAEEGDDVSRPAHRCATCRFLANPISSDLLGVNLEAEAEPNAAG